MYDGDSMSEKMKPKDLLDIVHSQSPENISKLFDFLKSMGAFYRRLDHRVIEPNREDLAGVDHALLATRLGPLDVLAVIEGGKAYDDLLENTIEIEFRGHVLRVLDLNTMIELKKTSNVAKAGGLQSQGI